MPIEWIVDQPRCRLGLGDSVQYDGDADLVFTHIYGPLPPQLIGKPAIINVFGNKKAKAEEWCGAELHEVSKWARGQTNTMYVANLSIPELNLTEHVEDLYRPGRGWFPFGMCVTLLVWVGWHVRGIQTVIDPFMGRGTVGKAVLGAGVTFIGIDLDPERVELARAYLDV